MRWWLALALVNSLVACTGTDPEDTPPDDGRRSTEFPPPDPLPEKYIGCTTSEDCVVVQLGCCDHCNGGLAVAVREASKDAVEERYSERCRPRQACTLIGCPPVRAACSAEGQCEAVQDTGF